jgi:hypothetical protein
MKTLTKILATGLLAFSLFNCRSPILHYENKSELENDGNYPGIVIFCYNENKITDAEVKSRFEEFNNYTNEIIDNSPEFRGLVYEPIKVWFDREAKKYGKNIDIPLTLHKKQIKVPKRFIDYSKEYPLDINDFSEYIKLENNELKKYDFITFMYSDDNAWEKTSHRMSSAYVDKYSKSIFLRVSYTLGSRFYDGLGRDNSHLAHEFLHLLGAEDKYNAKDGIYNDNDIMRNNSGKFDKDIIISEQTAREISW